MTNIYVWVNDALVPADEATVKITDLAVQRGYGIFDFFKTVDAQPVFLDDHLDRFYHSAELMRLSVKQSREELKQMIRDLIQKNGFADSGIRITLTGGYSPDGYNIAEPNLIITQQGFQLSKELQTSGISIITHPYQRQFADAKTLDYLKAIWLQPDLKKQGVDDVLYVHEDCIRECPRANFFIVSADGKVLTQASEMLKGITRKHILEISGKMYPTEERDVSLEELRNAKEAFITSTTKNVMPVLKIDGKVLGDGKPGEVTQSLALAYNKLVYS